jgi:hypothetical protein
MRSHLIMMLATIVFATPLHADTPPHVLTLVCTFNKSEGRFAAPETSFSVIVSMSPPSNAPTALMEATTALACTSYWGTYTEQEISGTCEEGPRSSTLNY